jgi:hypothetical protein
MGRNFLAHTAGDTPNAVLAAAGYNFRRLLKWLALLCAFLLGVFRLAERSENYPVVAEDAFFTDDGLSAATGCRHGWIRYLSLHVEVKQRFGTAGALPAQSPPARTSYPCCAVADRTIADEVDIVIVFFAGPMALEIVEARRAAGKQPMRREVTQRERKIAVSADQLRRIHRKPLRKSLCATSTMQGSFIDESKKKPGPKTGLSLLCHSPTDRKNISKKRRPAQRPS